MTRAGHAAVAIALTVAAAGCGTDPDPVVDLGAVDLEVDHHLVVDAEGFDPHQLVVAAGDVVEVVNADDVPRPVRGEDRVDLGTLEPGESALVILDDADDIRLTSDELEGSLVVTP